MTRAYTVAEIDDLRDACYCRIAYGSTIPREGAFPAPRPGHVEEMVRTHMLAGHTGADLRAEDERKAEKWQRLYDDLGQHASPEGPKDGASEPKPDLTEALATIQLAQLLEGTHRINVDPFDPSKATATMPDGTTVAGTLDARGNFTPSPTTQGEPNVQSDG